MSYRIAYMALVYDDPVLFARLAKAIESPCSVLFVHVDRKADLRAFKQLAPPSDKVIYLEGRDRHRVYWGGYSQVAATLSLMRRAVDVEPEFDRFVLLSNADYPIKPIEQIERALQSKTEFMRIDRRLQLGVEGSHTKFLHFHLLDNFILNPKGLGYTRAGLRLTRWIAKIPRRFDPTLIFYHAAAQWWALTRGCVEHILCELDRHPHKYSPFRRMLVPGEILFHTIVKASPFASKVIHDFTVRDPRSAGNEFGPHYQDWTGPHSSSPRWLDESDEPKLRRSSSLFARKLSSRHSSILLDRLDQLHR
jgi:hypothetical protein